MRNQRIQNQVRDAIIRGEARGATALVSSSAACGLGLAYADLLIAIHAGPWMGGTPDDWLAWYGMSALYVIAIGAGALVLSFVMKWAVPRVSAPKCAQLASGCIALMLSLLLLATSTGRVGAVFGTGIILAPCILTAVALLIETKKSGAGTRVNLLALLGVLSGIGVARASETLHYLLRDTAGVVPMLSVVSAGIVIAMVALLASFRPSTRIANTIRLSSVLLAVFGLPALIAAWPVVVQASHEGKQPYNVVLITADALRADYCETFGGHVPTPNLTRLANNGAKFDAAYVAAPWTIPSLNAIFSVRYPPGLTPQADVRQREQEQLYYHDLASYWLETDGTGTVSQFARNGYETGAYVGNGAMREQRWLINQFRHKLVVDWHRAFEEPKLALNPLAEQFISTVAPGAIAPGVMDTTAAATKFTRGFLHAHANRPFFLWVHFLDPHTPYDPPARFRGQSLPSEGRFIGEGAIEGTDRELSRDDVRDLYAGEIRYMDEAVGEILDAIAQNDLADNTYVAFSSDHGEELWDRGQHGHGHTMYDELLRVPMLISGPAIPRSVISQPVSTLSIMPTLLDLVNISGPAVHAGFSLEDALFGRPCTMLDQPAFAQATYEFVPPSEPKQMVRDGNYKFVRWLISGERRLYDTSADPGERDNLVDKFPEIAQQMESKLDGWQETFPADFTTARGARNPVITLETPSPQLRENLEALGYL